MVGKSGKAVVAEPMKRKTNQAAVLPTKKIKKLSVPETEASENDSEEEMVDSHFKRVVLLRGLPGDKGSHNEVIKALFAQHDIPIGPIEFNITRSIVIVPLVNSDDESKALELDGEVVRGHKLTVSLPQWRNAVEVFECNPRPEEIKEATGAREFYLKRKVCLLHFNTSKEADEFASKGSFVLNDVTYRLKVPTSWNSRTREYWSSKVSQDMLKGLYVSGGGRGGQGGVRHASQK